jgi:ABC-2 type transport system ATP-binding protein
MSILFTTDLTKKFGTLTALDRVNLEVNPGEVYGFIGPNGSGKTTAIRVMLGILRATEGSASLFGMDAWRDAVEIHKRVAYVPGDVNLWSNLTGGEVIDLFVRLRGANNKNRRDELIEKFDLDPSKKCRTYSKGNRQKVALVAAFSSDAELLILDEPTSGLDPLMERVFQDCVLDMKKEGKSIFLSSHILSEVEKLCDRLSIIRLGKIMETGTLTELRHLTRTNIHLETKEPINILAKMEGIHDLAQNGVGYSFQIDSEKIGTLISGLGSYEVTLFESTPPNLEDLFLRHYTDQAGPEDVAAHPADASTGGGECG